MSSCAERPVQFWLSTEAHRWLRVTAAQQDKSISEFCRDLVRAARKPAPDRKQTEPRATA